jgi:hypothetical protein
MSTITSWHQISSQLRSPNNPVVFFEMQVGPTPIGRLGLSIMSIMVILMMVILQDNDGAVCGRCAKDSGEFPSVLHRGVQVQCSAGQLY